LRWGYQLISKTMSPGQIMDVLARITFEAISAGWIADESAVQSRFLETLVKEPSGAGATPTTQNRRRQRKMGAE
jgi:hypothetical protein